jgi:pyrimidine-nucleoside phosphorylase
MRLDARDVVARKRDGYGLSDEEIRALVLGYAREEVPDYVASAFLMACFIRGLDAEETLALTRAMVDSGETLTLREVSRPKVDKHSTGGVADGVTLVFAPLAASLGLAVAKLSGRGLGHTGGTLDKLESIPGLRTDLTTEELERQVDEVGCAVAAQTRDLVPADGALYALRDATATVPSIPLIAASVMSKKLAVETDLILLDVKAGSGAFMKTVEDAGKLAAACARLAAGWGRRARAAVTDMSQPLGDAVGNALDVAEAVRVLRGEQAGRLAELTTVFATAALGSLEGVPEEDARARAEKALTSGRAAETFARMVEAQGGDPRVVDDPWSVLPRASSVTPITSDRAGWLTAVDAEGVGRAAIGLGAGRSKKEDPIDPAVGVMLHVKVGDRVEPGAEIGEVHARDAEAASRAAEEVRATISVEDQPAEPPPLVHGWRDA